MTKMPISQTLKEMAQLTNLTGRISYVQEINLKNFPIVFFNEVKECVLEYNLSPIEAKETSLIYIKPFISYRVILDEDKNTDLDKRFLALEKSIETLFWSDIVVEVFFNGKLKHRSA